MAYSLIASSGTISIADGGTSVTGVDTAFDLLRVAGGFLVCEAGYAAVASVESDTALTLEAPLIIPAGSGGGAVTDGSYLIYRGSSNAADAVRAYDQLTQFRQLVEQITISALTRVSAYGADLAGRDAYDDEWLDVDGNPFVYAYVDGSGNPVYYAKIDETSANWTAAFNFTGQGGEDGDDGDDGLGVPIGGNLGDLPIKNSAADGDIVWARGPEVVGIAGLYPRGGSFSSLSGDNLLRSTSPSLVFTPTPGFFNSFSDSVLSDAGQFFHNNTNYGGSGETLTDTVYQLCQKAIALHGGDYRFGASWHVAKCVAGAGTVSPGTGPAAGLYTTLYPFQTAMVPSDSTFKIWYRKVSGGPCYLRFGDGGSVYFDGVKLTLDAGYHLLTDTDWHFIFAHVPAPNLGYVNTTARLYATAGAEVHVALPDYTPGKFFPNAKAAIWTPLNRT